METSRSVEILERLVGFPTLSRTPNTALLDFAEDILRRAGATTERVRYQDGRENLYAVMGPADRPPVLLSGHSDVVPVEGQAWTKPPFSLTRAEGKLFGRGTADMKGFCAAAIAAMERAGQHDLTTPLALALSADEEVGCLGVHSLINVLRSAPVQPALVIVGEPTSMAVATGHKGKTALRATFQGRESHSALAPMGLNALHLAADFIGAIRRMQAEIEGSGHRDSDYDVPYTTLHAGKLSGGVALNIVPNEAVLDFEIRAVAEDDMAAIIGQFREEAAAIAAATGDADAQIQIEEVFAYPGLATSHTHEAVDFVKQLTGANGTIKVAFGTDGGLFADALGVPVVVCGPGSMREGHRPDEFIAESEMSRCDAMLDQLIGRLKNGL
ncbi:MAG: acetylornithine deacetylase [Pseudomonadota bacterium]